MEADTLLKLSWDSLTTASGASFLLIFAAEIGDKSQIACMALAARYRAAPVMVGATLAFLLLNSLAVVFGAAIASWLPDVLVSSIVAISFAGFGVHALRVPEDEHDDVASMRTGAGIVAGTFLLITVAEFGDKTQLAVVGLSSTTLPAAVWIGATVALLTTSALGVWVGRTLLQRMPVTLLHRASGLLFLSLAALAGYQAWLAM